MVVAKAETLQGIHQLLSVDEAVPIQINLVEHASQHGYPTVMHDTQVHVKVYCVIKTVPHRGRGLGRDVAEHTPVHLGR